MAERGERATGTPNTIYDLTSVLYHCLEGGASYDQYIQDAEEADDRELVEFFTRVRDEDSRRAQEAQLLLAARTLAAVRAEGGTDRQERMTDEASPRAQEAPPPRTSGIEEGAMPTTTGEASPPPPRREGAPSREEAVPTGDAPPRTEETAPREREGASRQPEQEREGDDRGLLEKARDALLGEEEPPPRSREEADRPEERRQPPTV